MINYESMTDTEIDKLCAEMMNFSEFPKACFIKVGDVPTKDQCDAYMDFEWWKPTDVDSIQVEKYLFPKLQDKENKNIYFSQIDINENRQMHRGLIVYRIKIYKNKKIIATQEVCEDSVKNNRAKAIACLIAWDKLIGKTS